MNNSYNVDKTRKLYKITTSNTNRPLYFVSLRNPIFPQVTFKTYRDHPSCRLNAFFRSIVNTIVFSDTF